MGKTAGEAGWRVSRYNVAARIPDSDKIAVANLFRGTCGAYIFQRMLPVERVEIQWDGQNVTVAEGAWEGEEVLTVGP